MCHIIFTAAKAPSTNQRYSQLPHMQGFLCTVQFAETLWKVVFIVQFPRTVLLLYGVHIS